MLKHQQRQDLYRFFARIFTYPDLALSQDLPHELASARTLLTVELPQLDPFPTLDDLKISFTELFISRTGGVPAPPYGSVYLEENKQLMGQTTLCVLRAYEGEGLNHDSGGEPPDFIATEMEFLYYLLGQEIEALAQDNCEAARIARQKQIDFWHTLFQSWVPPFCRRIIKAEPLSPLYSLVAELLLDFLRHEEQVFSTP